jgi:hypothetical protein
MTRRGTPDPVDLAERTGLTISQVETGLALMRTGNTSLINKTISGRLTAEQGLATARKGKPQDGS